MKTTTAEQPQGGDKGVCPACRGARKVPDPKEPGKTKPCLRCRGTGTAGSGYLTK